MELRSQERDKLIPALIAAKKEFKPLIFDKRGVRNDYASPGAILDAVEEALLNNGLWIEFKDSIEDGEPIMYTILEHISGQYNANKCMLRFEGEGSQIKSINQQYGAALTYAQRYALRSILCLYADTDDFDNYEHTQYNAPKKTYKPETIKVSPPSKKITKEQLEQLNAKLKDQLKLAETLMKIYKVDYLADIPYKDTEEFMKILDWIDRNISAENK